MAKEKVQEAVVEETDVATAEAEVNEATEKTTEDTTTTERVDGANLAGIFTGSGNLGSSKPPPGDLWSTSASFSFSYNNANPNNPQKTFSHLIGIRNQ